MQNISQVIQKPMVVICFCIAAALVSPSANSAPSEDELIALLWTCNPSISEVEIRGAVQNTIRGYTNAGYGDDHTQLNLDYGVRLNCDDSTREQLSRKWYGQNYREIFAHRYVLFRWTVPGIFSDTSFEGSVQNFKSGLKRSYSNIAYSVMFSPEYHQMKKSIEDKEIEIEKAKEAKRIEDERKAIEKAEIRSAELAAQAATRIAEEAARKAKLEADAEAEKIRKAKLQDGSLVIASFDDALLKFEPLQLWPVMKSPLIKPDGKIYAELLDIDSAQGENLIIAKGGVQSALEFLYQRSQRIGGDEINYGYAALGLSSKTKDFSPSGLRLGQRIGVIGKYVANRKFMSESGIKIIPELEVMYIDLR